MNKLGSVGAPGTGSLLYADPASEHQLLIQAANIAERKALNVLREYQEGIGSSNGDGSSQR
jgi:quinol---cytochrome-c reductase cytochrome b subunit